MTQKELAKKLNVSDKSVSRWERDETAAVIGFCVAYAFYLSAIICESCFAANSLNSVNAEELCDKEPVIFARKSIIERARYPVHNDNSVRHNAPACNGFYGEQHGGIDFEAWLANAIPYALAGIALSVAASWITGIVCDKKGVYSLSPVIRFQQKRKLKYCAIVAAIMLVTFFGQAAFNSSVSAASFAKGRVFTDADEFIEYMETYKPNDEAFNTLDEDGGADVAEYCDVHASDGGVIGEYRWLNKEAILLEYCVVAGSDFSVAVYTAKDLAQGSALPDTVNLLWVLLYVIELAGGFALYFMLKNHALNKKECK